MKTKTLRKLVCGMALLGMSACVEEELVDGANSVVEVKADIEAPISFTSSTSLDVPQTRTFINESATTSAGVGTMWRTSEEIGVYGSYSKNTKFTSTNNKDASEVSFQGFMLGAPKYAYYPYSSENNGVSQTAVKGSMPILHEYHTSYKDLVGDFRVGTLDSRSWFSSTFTFTRLVSYLKFSVDASGTELVNSTLKSITMKVNNKRQITGDFTINLQTKQVTMKNFAEGNDSLCVVWSNQPTLSHGTSRVAYATAMPEVRKGDEITFVLTTGSHIATIKTTATTDYVANGLYYYTLVLKDLGEDEMTVESLLGDKEEEEVEKPSSELLITNMRFTVANNLGKILPRSFKVENGTVTYSNIKEVTCSIDHENLIISLELPYLNNRKLIPTFDIPEGAICANGLDLVVSDETMVDFAVYDNIVVGNEAGDMTMYDIELKNSGLPVVVINQETGTTSTESNSDYKGGSDDWFEATGTQWLPKNSDWLKTDVTVDNFMVYNADGTSALTDGDGNIVEEPVLSSTRVRGNVSQRMPKKPFAVKLDKKHGIFMKDGDSENDLPEHKRWVLLANWKDRTLMRNEVAFGLAKVFKETFPNDGMEWNPSGQFVELVYNGVHVGNYYLCEQIKIDGDRLDINDPYEDSESTDPADWGYLFELDDAYDEAENGQFMSKHYIPFLSKDANSTEGLDYAKDIIYGVEDNLYNQKYDAAFGTFDLTSAIDYWLIQELMMNSETQHPKSVYMYINDGKLFTGPLWDFDWNTLPISSSYSENGYTYTTSILADAEHYRKSGSGYPSGPYESSSWFSTTTDKNYIWYPMLVKSTTFKEKAKERWDKVKPALIAYANTLPTIAEKLADSERVNYSMWRVDTKSEFKRPSLYNIGHTLDKNSGGYCGDEGMSFKDAVQELSDNLIERINGMDNFVSSTNWPNISIQSSNK